MSANAPAVNVRAAYCPNCDNEYAVVPSGVIRDEEEPTILFSISYKCTHCGEIYDPSNP
jgi:transposase-like protein